MVWDLRRAMLKKEEFESARLMDFDFRQRIRATRLLARDLSLEESDLVRDTAALEEKGLIDLATALTGRDRQDISERYAQCFAKARQELVAEIGDPTPYRLG
ncbi:hypothetical protein KK137_06205 [Croceibacterium sp. LX-88]|uniref:Uncharacterized protein n=2 Tax=Croceibacterium selenioxidans TaxID=2838833 RepID=A0ABS5W2F4_9SPHN|nr:hypothetical protein [Croceibacterium selenioxidans]